MSDRNGRKLFIVGGLLLQALALGLVAIGQSFTGWAIALVLLGAGTAMVYPALLATIGDVAHPAWQARAVGVYRLWRDGGFAVGPCWSGSLQISPESLRGMGCRRPHRGLWICGGGADV